MARTVNIHEAKTHLSRLLEDVRRGERVIIAKAGEPVAELVPVSRPDIAYGALASVVEIDDRAFWAADAELAAMFDPELFDPGLEVDAGRAADAPA